MLDFIRRVFWLEDDPAQQWLGVPSLYMTQDDAGSTRRVREALAAARDARRTWSCVSDPVWDALSSEGQSPCEMLAALERICADRSATLGIRGAEDVCLCSAPGYNLFSACVACQRPPSQMHHVRWPTLDQWLTTCPHFVPILPFPVPHQLQIPPWAYAACPQGGHFNVSQASLVAREHVALLASRSTAIPIDALFSPTSIPDQEIGSNSSPPIAAIVGGVIGGIVVLVAIGVFVWLFLRSKRRQAELDNIVNGQHVPSGQNAILTPLGAPQMANYGSGGTTALPPHLQTTPWQPAPAHLRTPIGRGPTTLSAESQLGSSYGAPAATAGAIGEWRHQVAERGSTHSLNTTSQAPPSTFSGPTTRSSGSEPDMARIRSEVRSARTDRSVLSDDDVDRIASRVAALMGGGAMGLGQALGAAGVTNSTQSSSSAGRGQGSPGVVSSSSPLTRGLTMRSTMSGESEAPPAYTAWKGA